jgi:hypothetical protein
MKTKSPKMVIAGQKAAVTRKRRKTVQKAARTARWARTMTKWLVTRTSVGTKWQLVEFAGPGGSESRGIVDLLAVRKNHSTPPDGLKRGDLFELILFQVKGGAAPWPSLEDIARLRSVARHHRAKSVVLAEWKKGKQPTLFTLKRASNRDSGRRSSWAEATSVDELLAY